MFKRKLLLLLGLMLAWGISAPANAGIMILDEFVDQSPATIDLPATKLLMATVITLKDGGGNDATATAVSIGGSVVAADIAEVCVDYDTTEVSCQTNPSSLSNISLNLPGNNAQKGGAAFDYRVTLNSSAGGKTIQLTVESITNTNLTDTIPLPESTALRSVAGAATAPTVTADPAAGIAQNSATLGGEVTTDGGATVTARGIVWNTTSPAETGGTVVTMGSGTGTFSQTVSSLPAGTLIYFKAYATNSAGTSYSTEDSFTTLVGLPTVTADPAANIGETSATLGGEVTADGGGTVTTRGIVWNTTSPAETGGTLVPMGSGVGTFSQTVNSLPSGTLIYFKAYATNSAGTAYSTQDSFTTATPAVPPTVTADPAADIAENSTTLGGNVTADGGATVTARGIVWNTTSPAETGGTVVPMGSGLGTFSQTVGSLPSGTQIYFKAYATNTAGTAYSAEDSFTTSTPAVPPTVTADPAADIAQNSATLGGDVTADGGATVTARGIVWNTTSPAETGGTVVPIGSGLGTFSQTVSSLPAGTQIYFKAYATNSAGTAYSTEDSFTTLVGLPTVTADTAADIAADSATLGGEVTSGGGDTVTARGIVWNTTSPAETGGTVVSMGSGVGTFSQTVSSLPSGTLIYFKAYATNSAGTAYSTEDSFNTLANLPTVTADAASDITADSATLGGEVTADGGATVTESGIVWNTTSPAETGGTVVPMGSGVSTFSQTVNSLPSGTQIYFKAYATNSAGTAYSTEDSFITLVGLATVTVDTAADIAADSATLGGEVISDGGATVTARGIVWNTTSPAETGGTVVPMGSGLGTFSQTVSSLPSDTLIYFKAYATNSAGTAYSTEDSFNTLANLPTVTADAAADITADSATLGGEVTADGGATVTARGIVWNTTSPAETGGTVVPMGSGLGTFSQTVSSLPADTLIYFKAYATNSAGTGYSAQSSFTTDTATETQASDLTFATIAGRSVRLTWIRGSLDGVIVVMRLAATGITHPSDGDDYIGDPDFSIPPPELPTNSENYVVYKGPGTSVVVTGLDMTTSYSVAVYEYSGTGASTTYLAGPDEATDTTTDYAVHNYDFGIGCDSCHNHGSFGARGPELKAICSTCHNPTGLASAKLEFGYEEVPTTTGHPEPTKNPSIDVVDCGMCHELHNLGAVNTTESYNAETLQTLHNKSFLRANVDKYVSTASPPAYLHTDDSQGGTSPDRAVEGGNDTTATGYCQVCHSLTDYHRSSDTQGAPDQCHDGATNDSCGPAEVHCVLCHDHNNNFGASGGGSCTGCHDKPQGARPIITAQFDRFSSHVTGGSGVVTPEDCGVCHDQSTHMSGQTVRMLNADDGVTSYAQPTAAADTLSTGEGEAFAPACLSCHDANGAASLPADSGPPTSGQTESSPFTDSGAPPVINSTDWSNAGHNRPVATSGSSPVTCVGDGTNGCHGSGHGSEQHALLAPADVSPASSMTDFCFTCHDSDGPSTWDIQSEFAALASAPGVVPVTSAGGATVDNFHDTTIVSCNECHSPHVNNSSEPVADPDTDLPLATYSSTGSYNEDGHTFSYNSGGNYDPLNPEGAPSGGLTQPDYIQFCLACHDGTTPPGVTMTANMINIATAYNGTDQHGSGDGSTGTKTSKGGLKAPWVNAANDSADNDPSQNYAAMNCTTCHGAHGTGSIYNLRESITVAGTVMQVGGLGGFLDEAAYNGNTTYTLPLIGGNQADHYWGAWCTFCHKGDSHPGKVEADSCTGGHMHGGGAF